MTGKTSKKNNVWGVIGGVLAGLAALVAVLTYLKVIPICNPFIGCEPKFIFTYEGTGKPHYEVAEGLYFSDNTNQAILPFSVTVEVLQYSGNQYSGEMDVWVEWIDKDGNKQQELVGKWDSFRNQHNTPAKINLFPGDLMRYASLPAAIKAYSWDTTELVQGSFDIVVRYTDSKELARETVTVAHTPWYHQVLLDETVISPKKSVSAHVQITNLGEPSNFKITGVLYDTTTPDILSITDDQDWWVERTWKSLYSSDIITVSVIGTNKNSSLNLTVPGEYLLEGHTYALGVTVFKELPYLKYANINTTWINSGERWRYRDSPVYISIFVIK